MYQFLASSSAKPTRQFEEDNQDYYLYNTYGKDDSLFYVLVVCDGVSASSNGREASRIACTNFINFFDDQIEEELINNLDNIITRAIRFAHDQIIKKYPSFDALTTLTAAIVIPVKQMITFANVGDSPAYYFTGDIVKECFKEDVKSKPKLLNGKTIIVNGMPVIERPITASLGFNQIINPNIHSQSYQKGDAIGICSDGLDYRLIKETLKKPNEIEEIIKKQTFKSKDDCTMIALILDQTENDYLLAKKLMDYDNLADQDKNILLDALKSKSQQFDGLLDKAYQSETKEALKIKIFSLLPKNLYKKRLVDMADTAVIDKMPKLKNKIIAVLNISY